MKAEQLNSEIAEFSKATHGSTDYYKDETYVQGGLSGEFAPLSYLVRKFEWLKSYEQIIDKGFIFDSLELFSNDSFQKWYETQFGRKLKRGFLKKVSLLHLPDNRKIFDAVEVINKSYDVLKTSQIVLNGKKLPVQLGEWYAKCIFGLKQKKSTSQRGFDFFLGERRLEVKVHWGDFTSPKGVKLRKSLVDLSEICIVVYIAQNFMIREICILDSSFVVRKFAGKGHTIFLKDADISSYFFSKSVLHHEKVVNSSSLLKFAAPSFAMNIAENFSSQS